MTSQDKDTLSSGPEASPFTVRSCPLAKRSNTRVGGKGLALSPRQSRKKYLATSFNDLCVTVVHNKDPKNTSTAGPGM